MSPDRIKAARLELGLSLWQAATLLGFLGGQRRAAMFECESGKRTLSAAQTRLLHAYLAGYRPADWDEIAASTETPRAGNG